MHARVRGTFIFKRRSMALSHTPIPPDPGYENPHSFRPHTDSVARGHGRVRPEAADIAMMHKRGTVGHLLTNPLLPPKQLKYSVQKNHYKENLRRIQRIQAQSKKKQLEAQTPVEIQQKSTKYNSIPSKVFLQFSNPPLLPLDSSTCEDAHPKPSTKKKNFLALNIQNAARTQVKRPPSRERPVSSPAKCGKDVSSHQRGTIPQYLVKRKEEWQRAEEERIKSLPDPSVPPGHTMMPDRERRETLNALQEDLSLLTTELQALPLCRDTLHIQQKKIRLETKMSEIEDAIKIFSKPKVFIKV